MKSRYFLMVVLVFMLKLGNAQCNISELNVSPSECNSSGDFFVTINFAHVGTSLKFKVLGNGVNYGTFEYANLPITLGPLDANCTTNYEFVVRDVELENCVAFKNIGTKCCNDLCKIAFKNVEAGTCTDSKYTFHFDLDHETAPDNGFDLFNNGVFYGYYQYSQLPLSIADFPSSISEPFNTIVVCANDKPNCCDTLELVNPCICSISKVRGQVVECSETTGTFWLRLNFKHSLTSDSFLLGGNAINYGKFAYKDLPITLKNLPFNPTLEYEFLIVDEDDAFCFGSYELGIVNECNFDCMISNVVAEPYECVDGKFYVDIAFDEKNTSLEGFVIRGNGQVYGNFEYGETSYKIGPLNGDCVSKYEFVVKDKSIPDCASVGIQLGPICCDVPCAITELVITEECENNDLVAFKVNFNHTQQTGSFVLRINNILIGTYAYADLPIRVVNTNFAPNAVFKIFHQGDETCRLIKEYTFNCTQATPCKLYDLTVKASECNEDNKFYGILKFFTTNPGNNGFIVKINGTIYDTLEYGQTMYEIGPLAGDCATIYSFLVQDVANPDCRDDFSLPEKVCCNPECKLSNPVVSYTACEGGKYHLNLNFSHLSNTQKFRIKVNGVIKGPYLYADLPIVIENLEEKKAYEIIVWDIEKEACRFTMNIPGLECTSATSDVDSRLVQIKNNNDQIEILLAPAWIPGKMGLYDISGNKIKSLPTGLNSIIDISNLPAGMYLIHLTNEKHSITKKIMKF